MAYVNPSKRPRSYSSTVLPLEGLRASLDVLLGRLAWTDTGVLLGRIRASVNLGGNMLLPDNPEIGRELKASELKVGTIVVVQPPGKSFYITLWVEYVSPLTVVLHSATAKMSIICLVKGDETIQDLVGSQVRIFEYLGEP